MFTLLQQPINSLEELLSSLFLNLVTTADTESQTHLFDNLFSFIDNMHDVQKNTGKEAAEITDKLISRGYFHVSLFMRSADDFARQHVFEVLLQKVKHSDYVAVYRAVRHLDLTLLPLSCKEPIEPLK